MTSPKARKHRHPGRPASLSREAIVAAAVRILDERARDGLTMRAVAARLGVGAMSVYHYVPDRATLEQMIIERLLADIPIPSPRMPWKQRLTMLAQSIRELVVDHPNATALLAQRRYTDAEALRPLESLLGTLRDAGLSGPVLLGGTRAVLSYAIGFAHLDLAGPITPENRDESDIDGAPFAAVSPEEFPNLVHAAYEASQYDLDEQFRRGLEPLIAGLEAYTYADTVTR